MMALNLLLFSLSLYKSQQPQAASTSLLTIAKNCDYQSVTYHSFEQFNVACRDIGGKSTKMIKAVCFEENIFYDINDCRNNPCTVTHSSSQNQYYNFYYPNGTIFEGDKLCHHCIIYRSCKLTPEKTTPFICEQENSNFNFPDESACKKIDCSDVSVVRQDSLTISTGTEKEHNIFGCLNYYVPSNIMEAHKKFLARGFLVTKAISDDYTIECAVDEAQVIKNNEAPAEPYATTKTLSEADYIAESEKETALYRCEDVCLAEHVSPLVTLDSKDLLYIARNQKINAKYEGQDVEVICNEKLELDYKNAKGKITPMAPTQHCRTNSLPAGYELAAQGKNYENGQFAVLQRTDNSAGTRIAACVGSSKGGLEWMLMDAEQHCYARDLDNALSTTNENGPLGEAYAAGAALVLDCKLRLGAVPVRVQASCEQNAGKAEWVYNPSGEMGGVQISGTCPLEQIRPPVYK